MRGLSVAFLAMIALLQYPLWLGKGGWLQVLEYDKKLQAQKAAIRALEIRNQGLDAEVRDLKQGYDAIEERARFEMGMIKPNEVFIQLPEAITSRVVPGPASTPLTPAARDATVPNKEQKP